MPKPKGTFVPEPFPDENDDPTNTKSKSTLPHDVLAFSVAGSLVLTVAFGIGLIFAVSEERFAPHKWTCGIGAIASLMAAAIFVAFKEAIALLDAIHDKMSDNS